MASHCNETRNTYITLQHVHLKLGSSQVLKDINLRLHSSEMHVIVGEHGAGKSSLAHIISGFLKPDAGKILVHNASFSHLTPELARKHGIEIVTQENPLFDHFSVAENIMIDHHIGLFPFLTRKASERKVRKFFHTLPFAIHPTTLLHSLNLADKALIDILKHLYPKPKLLILDETLVKLSNENRQKVLTVLEQLKARGLAILVITHRIDDIYQFADRVTIMRDGEKLTTDSIENIDKITLIRLAYTHVLTEKQIQDDQHFSQILKYNEAILTNLPINLIVVDKENKIMLVNKSAKTLFGFQGSEYKNLALHELFPKGNEHFQECLRDAIAQKKHLAFYQLPLHVNKIKTINKLIIYPIFDGPVLIGNIIIIEDITKQEKLREQMIL